MDDAPWKIVPIQVVKQTAKMIVVVAGSRDRRELMDGNQFDSLEAANAAVRDRLQMAYDNAMKHEQTAANNLKNWKDVVL